MRITRLTPEQACAAGEMLHRALAGLRRFFEQVRVALIRALETLRPIARRIAQGAALVRSDRPAWSSPYGPAPRRH